LGGGIFVCLFGEEGINELATTKMTFIEEKGDDEIIS